jgi:hypothetical protein
MKNKRILSAALAFLCLLSAGCTQIMLPPDVGGTPTPVSSVSDSIAIVAPSEPVESANPPTPSEPVESANQPTPSALGEGEYRVESGQIIKTTASGDEVIYETDYEEGREYAIKELLVEDDGIYFVESSCEKDGDYEDDSFQIKRIDFDGGNKLVLVDTGWTGPMSVTPYGDYIVYAWDDACWVNVLYVAKDGSGSEEYINFELPEGEEGYPWEGVSAELFFEGEQLFCNFHMVAEDEEDQTVVHCFEIGKDMRATWVERVDLDTFRVE